MKSWQRIAAGGLCVLGGFFANPRQAHAQHGVFLSGGGPVQRSMGGAATANPIDSLGAAFWNPATLSGLPHNDMTFGVELLIPHTDLFSSIPPNFLGPGVPPVTFSDTSHSDTGTMIVPNVGVAYRLADSNLTLGLGVISAAGFGVNYPASFTNPVLTPPGPIGLGLGNVYSNLQVYQIVPSISLQVNERLSIGVSPIVSLANLRLNPLIFAAPDDANGDTFFTYREATHNHNQWGGGFQVGVFWQGPACWNFGVSFKSPQWFETFRFNTVDELGLPREDTIRFDLPWIASVGVAYTGLERWTFAGDVRYIDYRNAEGFDASGFAPDGSVRGIGWDSQVVVTGGMQYQVSDRLSVRMGYSYNNNPQDSSVALFNVGAPTILEHTIGTGASWSLSECLVVSFAYLYAFENEVEGPLVFPGGAAPGTVVRSRVSADAFVLGMTVKY
ncbi:MAG: outer membrane protein transport protein [Gemmataceae bacterium]|nr:outer membrane protein transport protein [Gemmataceae bacterium]